MRIMELKLEIEKSVSLKKKNLLIVEYNILSFDL